MEHSELKDLEHWQSKYWNTDGLPLLATGLSWLLWGGAILLGLSLLKGSAYQAYWGGSALVLFFWGYAMQRMLDRLKQRITYPRAGYARIPVREGGIALRIIIFLWIALVVTRSFVRTVDLHGIGPFAVGILIALAIAVPVMRPWQPYRATIGLVYCGASLRMLDKAPSDGAVSWTLVGIGLVVTVVGLARLRRFLRESPKPVEAAE